MPEAVTTPAPELPEIIYPCSPYLPAYPGSYWVYKKNGSSTTKTISVAPDYVRDSTYYYLDGKYTTKRVPLYDNKPFWCSGYNVYVSIGIHHIPTNFPLVTEDKKGVCWSPDQYSNGFGYGEYAGIYASDTSLVINGKNFDHVIAVRSYLREPYPYSVIHADKYYAKNVGLVKWFTYNYHFQDLSKAPLMQIPSDSIADSYEVTSYFVNKN